MKATLWKGLDMTRTLFVLGNGFIGHEVVTEALTAGWQVKALVHSAEGALKLQQMGVQALVGDAQQPETWIFSLQGCLHKVMYLQKHVHLTTMREYT